MYKLTPLDTPEDLAWLREVHLPDAPEFGCAMLYGNEDCPDEIRAWKTNSPLFTQEADYVWLRIGDELVRTAT